MTKSCYVAINPESTRLQRKATSELGINWRENALIEVVFNKTNVLSFFYKEHIFFYFDTFIIINCVYYILQWLCSEWYYTLYTPTGCGEETSSHYFTKVIFLWCKSQESGRLLHINHFLFMKWHDGAVLHASMVHEMCDTACWKIWWRATAMIKKKIWHFYRCMTQIFFFFFCSQPQLKNEKQGIFLLWPNVLWKIQRSQWPIIKV
jgi:hypothetical protein